MFGSCWQNFSLNTQSIKSWKRLSVNTRGPWTGGERVHLFCLWRLLPWVQCELAHNDKRRLVSAIYYKFLRTETTKGQAEKQCTKLFSVRSLLESSESRASVRWKSVVKVNLSSVWKSLCVNPVLVKSCSYCCWGLFGEKGPISTVYTGFAQVYGQMEINVSY